MPMVCKPNQIRYDSNIVTNLLQNKISKNLKTIKPKHTDVLIEHDHFIA